MNKDLQVRTLLRKLNLILSDYTEYDDDRFAVIANAINTFHQLPAVKTYYEHREEIDEMVRNNVPLDEFLKGNYERKTFKEIRSNAK